MLVLLIFSPAFLSTTSPFFLASFFLSKLLFFPAFFSLITFLSVPSFVSFFGFYFYLRIERDCRSESVAHMRRQWTLFCNNHTYTRFPQNFIRSYLHILKLFIHLSLDILHYSPSALGNLEDKHHGLSLAIIQSSKFALLYHKMIIT